MMNSNCYEYRRERIVPWGDSRFSITQHLLWVGISSYQFCWRLLPQLKIDQHGIVTLVSSLE